MKFHKAGAIAPFFVFFFYCSLLFSNEQFPVTIKLLESKELRISGSCSVSANRLQFDSHYFTLENCSSSTKRENRENKIILSQDTLLYNQDYSDWMIDYFYHTDGEAFYINDSESSMITLPLIIKPENNVRINNLMISKPVKITCVDDMLIVVEKTTFANYLRRVVQKEMGNHYPREAIKTQFIVSRTKAIHHLSHSKNPYYDFTSSVMLQAVGKDEADAILEMYQIQTENKIIVYENMPIDAVFSSCCGDRTEANEEIWIGQKKPYLQPTGSFSTRIPFKKEGYCQPMAASSNWEKEKYHWKHLIATVNGTAAKNIKKIKIVKKTKSGRVTRIKIYTSNSSYEVKGELEIRKALENIPSTKIKNIGYLKTGIEITGKGYGHGVGLCQIGAINLARLGYSYEEIIDYYYHATRLIELKN